MALWEALLPVVVEAGLGALQNVQAGKDKKEEINRQYDLENRKLASEEKYSAERLALEREAMMQNAAATAAANELKKKQLVQQAYQMLIEAGYTGRGQEQNALSGLIAAGQRPLLG